MRYFTPERLFTIAVVITLISVDGIYRAWRQHQNEQLDAGLFRTYLAVLLVGSGLTWVGLIMALLR